MKKLAVPLAASLMALYFGACTGSTDVTQPPPTAGPSIAPESTGVASPSSPPSQSPASASLCPPVVEIDFDANQVVPGRANIFGAGRDLPPEPGGGGAGQLPPVWLLPTGSGRVVTITCAAGRVIPRDSDGIANGSAGDAYGPTDIESHEGVSGIIDAHNGMFLVGVFLTDSSASDPAPERLDFTDNETFDVLAPKIAQTFLVGDGIGRRYRVPSDATRLFLGFADAAAYRGEPGYYGNNRGSLEVSVEVTNE